MARYFAFATALVGLVIAILLALPRGTRDAPQSRYLSKNGATPGPATRHDGAVRKLRVRRLGGDAPWALSALPACFHQEHFARGSAAFVRTKLPADARLVAAGSTLATADCRLFVRAHDATVTRGEDALHLPPPTRLFVARDRLFLETREGARVTLRTYAIVAGGPPRFASDGSQSRTRPRVEDGRNDARTLAPRGGRRKKTDVRNHFPSRRREDDAH